MSDKAKIRSAVRRARMSGVPRQMAYDIATKVFSDENESFHIESGTKIKLDVDRIMSEKTYPNKLDEYKKFVEGSRDKVFTAVFHESTHMITLEEEPKWYFFGTDIVKCEEEDV